MTEDQIRELAYHVTDVLADRWGVNRCGTDQADDAACVEAFLRGRLTAHPQEDQIRDVIAQWRARAEGQGAIYASSLLDCADELERLLTERPQPRERRSVRCLTCGHEHYFESDEAGFDGSETTPWGACKTCDCKVPNYNPALLEQRRWLDDDALDEIREASAAEEVARAERPPPQEARHRCSGCGLRWEGPLEGAELCGDCWRQSQAVLLRESPR